MYVGLDDWDGTDFFLPKHYFGIMITTKAANVIKSHKLTNVELRNLAKIELDEGTAGVLKSKQDF